MKALARLASTFSVALLVCATTLDDARQLYLRKDYAAVVSRLTAATDPASLLLLGESYVLLGDDKKAVEALERAIALDNANSNAHLWLGRAYGHRAEKAFPTSALKLAGKSRENFEQAVALDPHNWDALDDLFQFYLQAPGFVGGGVDKAAKLIPAIAAHDPAEAAADRGRIAEQKKDYSTAESQYRLAVQLAPQQTGRAADLARVLAKRKASGN